MIRLETVEDFKKVRKALDDPNSKLADYCLIDYGYCGFCGSLSRFDRLLVPLGVYCYNCDYDFYSEDGGRTFMIHRVKEGKMVVFEYMLGTIPEPRAKQERELLSRENQRKIFNRKLESFIKYLKSEAREVRRKIRQLAKLRTTPKNPKSDPTRWALDNLF